MDWSYDVFSNPDHADLMIQFRWLYVSIVNRVLDLSLFNLVMVFWLRPARRNWYDGVEEFWVVVRETGVRTTETSYEERHMSNSKAPGTLTLVCPRLILARQPNLLAAGLAAGFWRSQVQHGWNTICWLGCSGGTWKEWSEPCQRWSQPWSIWPGLGLLSLGLLI